MNYCTLFNSQYLSRGLVLYESLLNTAQKFHLYIFAFDERAYQILIKLNLQHATIISLSEFETPALLKVKSSRTVAEYCWTCTSSVILYCLEKFLLADVCYLDADLYFWQDPAILIEEATDHSILITEHRYTKTYDHSEVSGKYCVQFMYFKNDEQGLEALLWWREACLEWCYNRVEPGRFGDQKYLDDWLERFDRVKVLEHLGGGVAPWNVQQYELLPGHVNPKMVERSYGKSFDLVFYHFHAVKFINNAVDYGGYKLSKTVKKDIYKPYVSALLKIEANLKGNEQLNDLLFDTNIHCKEIKSFSLIDGLRKFKNKIIRNNNYFALENF